MARIYTKTGDDGTTGLLHGGRVAKSDELVDAYGDIDEAVSALGVARAACADPQRAALLLRLQHELSSPSPTLQPTLGTGNGSSRSVPDHCGNDRRLEAQIDAMVTDRPLRPVFVVAAPRRSKPRSNPTAPSYGAPNDMSSAPSVPGMTSVMTLCAV